MIYTNNQGPKSWAESIRDYFHNKLKYEIFDQIIGAFKVKGKQIEIGRTSHYKSIKDLINCTKLPEETNTLNVESIVEIKEDLQIEAKDTDKKTKKPLRKRKLKIAGT